MARLAFRVQAACTAFGVDKHTGRPLFLVSERRLSERFIPLAGWELLLRSPHSVYLLRALAHLESLREGFPGVSAELLRLLRGSQGRHKELPGLP